MATRSAEKSPNWMEEQGLLSAISVARARLADPRSDVETIALARTHIAKYSARLAALVSA